MPGKSNNNFFLMVSRFGTYVASYPATFQQLIPSTWGSYDLVGMLIIKTFFR
jgi:hypothetical protein